MNKELLEDDTFIPKNMLEGIFSWRLFREVHKGNLLFRAFSYLFYRILKMIKENLTKITADPEKQEIIITCEFDAQREFVWKALTDPERVKRLWGPKALHLRLPRLIFVTEERLSSACVCPRGRITGARVFIAKLSNLSGLSAPIHFRMQRVM